MNDANIGLSLSRARIGIGLVAVTCPGLATRVLSGRRSAGIEPMLTRMLGARDLALGLGAVIAMDRGAPVRGWFEAAALSDAADSVSGLLARSRMNPLAHAATLALSSGSAALGIYLGRRLDPPPAARPHQPEAVITGHPE